MTTQENVDQLIKTNALLIETNASLIETNKKLIEMNQELTEQIETLRRIGRILQEDQNES